MISALFKGSNYGQRNDFAKMVPGFWRDCLWFDKNFCTLGHFINNWPPARRDKFSSKYFFLKIVFLLKSCGEIIVTAV